MPSTYHDLTYHIVFATKLRMPVVTDDLRGPLYRYISGILDRDGCRLLEIGGMPDHVHLLAGIRPRIAVATMVKTIKGRSSRWASERLGPSRPFGWQAGYAAFSVSRSGIPAVQRYIQRQPQHHRDRSYDEELVRLLDKHAIRPYTPSALPSRRDDAG